MPELEFSLQRHIDQELIKIIKHLVENPSLNEKREYNFHQIIDLPDELTLDSQQLFGIMSSALSMDKQMREKFFEQHPTTKSFFKTLGPNRLQYGMLVFNFLCRIDPLIIGIIQFRIRQIDDQHVIMDLYDLHDEFRFKKAIYLGSPEHVKARIIIHDKDPRIRELRNLP